MEDDQVQNISTPVASDQVQSDQTQKVFTRDQVSKMINAERSKAAQDARLEAEKKHQQDLEAAIQAKQAQTNASQSREVDANTIYQQVQEKFNAEMQRQKELREEQNIKAHMDNVAKTYVSKIEQGRTAYNDFDEVTKDFDPMAFPQLTYLLSGLDNAADVLYDLSQNPLKIAGLDRLAEKNPPQAQAELVKLSQSITTNKQAQTDAQNQSTAEPLDRLQPSRVSGSNGKPTIADLRNQPWLRG